MSWASVQRICLLTHLGSETVLKTAPLETLSRVAEFLTACVWRHAWSGLPLLLLCPSELLFFYAP